MILTKMFGRKKLRFTFLFVALVSMKVQSQKSAGFERLEELSARGAVPIGEVDINTITSVYDSLGNFNYIAPIRRLLENRETLEQSYGSFRYKETLATLLSFIGDYRNATETFSGIIIPELPEGPIRLSARYQKVIDGLTFQEFPSFLYEQAARSKVVMLNESHHRPQHRMVLLSVLDSLYKLGYRTLAAEALTNLEAKSAVKLPPTSRLGYYTAEPLFSEVFRYAVSRGYTLVPYEQLYSQFNIENRDSVQAINLINSVSVSDTAKLLIFAGYGHIEEHATNEPAFMAYYFKKLSGLDPFTMDQVKLSYGGFKGMEQTFYEALNKQRNITQPVVPILDKKPFSLRELCDASLILPKPSYVNGRPTWLTLGNLKKEYRVDVPKKYKGVAFLIQAYYNNEAKDVELGQLIPADQTYDKDKKFYSLFLFPGSYNVVIRDIDNQVIFEKEIKVAE